MKKYFLLLCTIIITVVTGCSKDSPIDNEVPNPIQKGFTVTITGDSLKGQVGNRVEFTGGYVTGAGLYDTGDSVTVTAIPYDGYVLDSFVGGPTHNPSEHSGASTYTFKMGNEVHQYTVNFKQLFTITAQASPGGSVSPDGVLRLKDGSTCTLTAIPERTYSFVGWYEGSAQVSTDATYTFTVSSNKILAAKFYEPTFIYIKEISRITVTDLGNQYATLLKKTSVITSSKDISIIYSLGGNKHSYIYDENGHLTMSKNIFVEQQSKIGSQSLDFVYILKNKDDNGKSGNEINWYKHSLVIDGIEVLAEDKITEDKDRLKSLHQKSFLVKGKLYEITFELEDVPMDWE